MISCCGQADLRLPRALVEKPTVVSLQPTSTQRQKFFDVQMNWLGWQETLAADNCYRVFQLAREMTKLDPIGPSTE